MIAIIDKSGELVKWILTNNEKQSSLVSFMICDVFFEGNCVLAINSVTHSNHLTQNCYLNFSLASENMI